MAMSLPAADPEEERETEEKKVLPQVEATSGESKDGGASGETIITTTTTTTPSKQLCGVCHENQSKYKCSRCFLPYCSLPCSTTHKTAHPTPPSPPIAKPPSSPLRESKKPPRPGTRAAATAKSPFAGLDNSVALQELFKTYPQLRSHLEDIHAAMLPPVDGDGMTNGRSRQQQQGRRKGGGGGGGRFEPWTQDRGLQNGVEALNRARVAYGKEGEGVREFAKLVLQVIERGGNNSDDGDGGDGTAAMGVDGIQREITEENARIISMLLSRETAR